MPDHELVSSATSTPPSASIRSAAGARPAPAAPRPGRPVSRCASGVKHELHARLRRARRCRGRRTRRRARELGERPHRRLGVDEHGRAAAGNVDPALLGRTAASARGRRVPLDEDGLVLARLDTRHQAELVDELVDLGRGGADHLQVAGRGAPAAAARGCLLEAVDRRKRRQDVVAGDRDELGESAVVRHIAGLLRSPGWSGD